MTMTRLFLYNQGMPCGQKAILKKIIAVVICGDCYLLAMLISILRFLVQYSIFSTSSESSVCKGQGFFAGDTEALFC